ncbi:hypothetical protein Q8F55_001451 [Vanrija albida]|uniref:Proteophosphoglycan ppg4 n=1 Tax=Vanrija albida TaxID=181172 RepID=A0ABR3QGI9_9TREE
MSASSGTTLISPSNANANAAAAASQAEQAQSLGQAAAPSAGEASAPSLQRRTTRSSAHSVHSAGHGHHERHHSGHHTAHHGAHPRRLSSHSSHGRRRGSEGEGGRRALAAGLTMHVLDAVKDKKAPVTKRKTSDASKTSTSAAAHHAVKSSRSDTHLPRLSRTASQVSVVSSGGSGSGAGKKRKDVPLHDRHDRRKGSVEVEVISGDGAGAAQPDDEEWESGGEDASGPASAAITPAAAVLAAAHPAAAAAVQEPRALPLRRAASDRPLQNAIAFTESPVETLSPRATLRATGFPSASSDRSLVDDQVTFATRQAAPPPALAHAAPDSHPGSTRPASTSTAAATPEEPAPGFPFPTMSEATEPTVASPTETRHRVVSQPPAPLRRLTSNTSLRSATSLRAPHPLNSPTGGRNGFAGVFGTTPSRQHRVASLHYPPAAPAVVYREHVEGQMEDYVPETPASMVLDLPELHDPPQRPRVGSFSSMRSLKDILGSVVGSPAPPASPSAQSTYSVGRPTTRRVATTGNRRPTAMAVASKAARLKTTSNPVEYHASLGFSSATAETAHLLSRFLPPKKPRRPRWAMTAREAHAAHEAAANGEEPRVGLTDGQYRAAHESLVTTLQELGGTKRTTARRASSGAGSGSLPRGYSYHSLLSAVDELAIGSHPPPESTAPTAGPAGLFPAKQGVGRSPFELSVARVLAQRKAGKAF